MNNYVTLH